MINKNGSAIVPFVPTTRSVILRFLLKLSIGPLEAPHFSARLMENNRGYAKFSALRCGWTGSLLPVLGCRQLHRA